MSERIGDLVLEHAAPAGRAHSRSVLFVHGMWGGSWYLRNYLYAAAQSGWDAWAVNLRGHGESPAPRGLGAVSFLDYVDDVRHCLDRLGEAVLVGHSMGGLIAQKVAEGGGVAAAVFLTSAPPRGILTLEWPVLTRATRYLPAIVTGRPFTMNPRARRLPVPESAHARAARLGLPALRARSPVAPRARWRSAGSRWTRRRCAARPSWSARRTTA